MLLTPHILTGAAIAARIQNPILGIFLAFLSHYLLDTAPQEEYSIDNINGRRWRKSHTDFLKVFLDITLGMLVIFFLAGDNVVLYVAALAAIIPDGFTLLFIIFPQNKILGRHYYYHSKLNDICGKRKIPRVWGVVSQLAVVALAIYFLL